MTGQMYDGPYDHAREMHDAASDMRDVADDYVREPDPTPGELVAMNRAAQQSGVRMTDDPWDTGARPEEPW